MRHRKPTTPPEPEETHTFPFTPAYRKRAKFIERAYRTDVTITTVFCVLMAGTGVWHLLVWVFNPQHDPWEFALAVVTGLLVWLWSRDYRSARTRRSERYVVLCRDIVMDHSIQQLITHEEDNA